MIKRAAVTAKDMTLARDCLLVVSNKLTGWMAGLTGLKRASKLLQGTTMLRSARKERD